MDNKHLVEVIKQNTQRFKSKNAFYYKNNELDKWEGISWLEFYNRVEKLSKALLNFGISEQQKLAIFAENMPNWIIADLAIMSVKAVSVPIFATNSTKEAEYIINDVEVSLLFVGDQSEYDKAYELLETSGHLKLIVALTNTIKLQPSNKSMYLEDFVAVESTKELETELQKRYYELDLNDIASIIYTSGTTGEPKGVMLDHHNFAGFLKAHESEIDLSKEDASLSFLPLSHIYERSWVFFCLNTGVEVYFNQDPKKIAEVLKEVKPTVMCTVPRIFEKIFAAIQEKRKEASPAKMKLASWALGIGNNYYNKHKRLEKKVPLALQLKYKIADKLVLSKLREVFGGRIKFMPCGGAPLAADMVSFFHSFGLNVKCGYGLTETTATVTFFGDTHFEFNSAGKPLKGTQIKIAENNEILVKGPGVMKGYYKKPEATAQAFKNGWFRTGDAGKIDEKGNLVITDRIKDLMKTSGGKYIAPQKLESALINDSFIEQIAVIGDQQKYVTALAVPSFENLKKYALEHKISFDNVEELIHHNQIKDLFERRFEELQKEFSKFEKIKKFTLLSEEFSIESGEITATLKLKRKVIQKKYKTLIDKMYSE
ncbi:AMP-dependent synthetase/ligase [Salegentibacter mishustinae]|uniref:Long-chain fatty acid--CoA ligase n=1 Tax=Salegentibacter mishustinae TaxID=270918 RepID=A0A0Q9ZN78_9FLAO|nr:long-chain fatty acid--CoA ligase [Salegentibacter mishustinae]KRG30660.1 long-chain fatty acid--CoA ligase [Salegentibacter mishustinae]PNW23548.1 long-chain fatty acid--CoA ligase [Salegentibacter mishustinae]PZX66627.1 long-chain acyl-CoA synthetase [Salegentibacter mishustinae]GGW83573.1 putative long-chain-fatty-acid--CoA ligase [Salegentibacter mishustinae]